jgi:hypothetical protein
MSEGTFTQEIFKQSQKVEEECQKLQALLTDKIPNTTFKCCPDNDEILLYKTQKRKRERVLIHDDNDEDDEDDEPEVKPKQSSVFKQEDDNNENDDDSEEDEDLIHHLSRFAQPLQNVRVRWGDEPQSPWSQHEEHAEQTSVLVPSITEPVAVPNLYTPECRFVLF